jgi:hypothetical protein
MRVRAGDFRDPIHELAVGDVRLVARCLLQSNSDLPGYLLPVVLVDLPPRAHTGSLRPRWDEHDGTLVKSSNLFDDLAGNLAVLKNNTLLDRVTLVDQTGRRIVYVRRGSTWTRL